MFFLLHGARLLLRSCVFYVCYDSDLVVLYEHMEEIRRLSEGKTAIKASKFWVGRGDNYQTQPTASGSMQRPFQPSVLSK